MADKCNVARFNDGYEKAFRRLGGPVVMSTALEEVEAGSVRASVGTYRAHRVKQSAVYRHLMTPSWAILLITSHVPNA